MKATKTLFLTLVVALATALSGCSTETLDQNDVKGMNEEALVNAMEAKYNTKFQLVTDYPSTLTASTTSKSEEIPEPVYLYHKDKPEIRFEAWNGGEDGEAVYDNYVESLIAYELEEGIKPAFSGADPNIIFGARLHALSVDHLNSNETGKDGRDDFTLDTIIEKAKQDPEEIYDAYCRVAIPVYDGAISQEDSDLADASDLIYNLRQSMVQILPVDFRLDVYFMDASGGLKNEGGQSQGVLEALKPIQWFVMQPSLYPNQEVSDIGVKPLATITIGSKTDIKSAEDIKAYFNLSPK